MLSAFRSKLTYANVVATIGLFVALGGSSYAAARLSKNAVKGPNIAPNAVSSSKVKNGALLSEDFRAGQLPAGGRGAAGQPGTQGSPGAAGSPGSDAQFNGAAAGGALSGSFPNPSLASGAVTASKLGALPAARITNGVDQPVSNASATTLTFDSEDFDTSNLHDNVTNSGRLTAPIAGLYLVSAAVRWQGNTAGSRQLSILDGTGAADARVVTPAATVTWPTEQSVTTLVQMNAGDYVEVEGFHNAGTTLGVQSATYSPAFSATWVGPSS